MTEHQSTERSGTTAESVVTVTSRRRRRRRHAAGLSRSSRGDLHLSGGLRLEELKEGSSPQQISGRFRLEGRPVGRQQNYNFIHADRRTGGDLWTKLRLLPVMSAILAEAFGQKAILLFVGLIVFAFRGKGQRRAIVEQYIQKPMSPTKRGGDRKIAAL